MARDVPYCLKEEEGEDDKEEGRGGGLMGVLVDDAIEGVEAVREEVAERRRKQKGTRTGGGSARFGGNDG